MFDFVLFRARDVWHCDKTCSLIRDAIIRYRDCHVTVMSSFCGLLSDEVKTVKVFLHKTTSVAVFGSFCSYRERLYLWSVGISLYLELFCYVISALLPAEETQLSLFLLHDNR